MYDPLGLSIGTTNLVAARNGSPPVIRRAVLTLYPHCAPKVGLPEENPYPIEPGMMMRGFVERIGDSVALVSADGSAHDPELFMVEALDAMVLRRRRGRGFARRSPSPFPRTGNPLRCRHCATDYGRIWDSSAAAWRPACLGCDRVVDGGERPSWPARRRCGGAARFRWRRHVGDVGERRGRFRTHQRHNALRGLLRRRDRPGAAAAGLRGAGPRQRHRPGQHRRRRAARRTAGNSAGRPRSGCPPTRSPNSPPSLASAAAA